jgi:hypothetical protein
MLSLAEAVVRDLKLMVLVRRWRCTAVEDGVCMPQLLDVLLKRARVQMLLYDGPASARLQVKHVLRVPDQCSYASVEVGPLGVGHGLKAMLPHRILLVTDRKEHDWHHGGVGEAGLTQGGECDLCRLLDGLIQLDLDDICHPQLRRVEGYHHVDLALVLAMGHRHAAAVDRSVPVVAELAECVVQHSRKTRAMLAREAKAPILSDGDVGGSCPYSSENTTMKTSLTPK